MQWFTSIEVGFFVCDREIPEFYGYFTDDGLDTDATLRLHRAILCASEVHLYMHGLRMQEGPSSPFFL